MTYSQFYEEYKNPQQQGITICHHCGNIIHYKPIDIKRWHWRDWHLELDCPVCNKLILHCCESQAHLGYFHPVIDDRYRAVNINSMEQLIGISNFKQSLLNFAFRYKLIDEDTWIHPTILSRFISFIN